MNIFTDLKFICRVLEDPGPAEQDRTTALFMARAIYSQWHSGQLIRDELIQAMEHQANVCESNGFIFAARKMREGAAELRCTVKAVPHGDT